MNDSAAAPISLKDQHIQVSLADCFLQQVPAESIGREVLALMDKQDHPRVLIDFADVDFVSSASLGALLMIRNAVDRADGRLALACVNRKVKQLFKITALETKFPVYESLAVAETALLAR